jgi:hypothetical protein
MHSFSFPTRMEWTSRPTNTGQPSTMFYILRYLAWTKAPEGTRGNPPRLPVEVANGDKALLLTEVRP